jgi:hypothetical protein
MGEEEKRAAVKGWICDLLGDILRIKAGRMGNSLRRVFWECFTAAMVENGQGWKMRAPAISMFRL